MIIKKIAFLLKVNLLKTLYVNFSQFKFRGLMKIPIIFEYGVKYRNKGKIVAKNICFNMLEIKSKSSIMISKNGKLILNGSDCLFNSHSRILIGENAIMELGNRFSANTRSDYNCFKHVVFGNNVLLSVNIMIIDTDFHEIFNEKGEQINLNKEIVIGDNVWIGCNTTILKGTKIGNNIVIGACSLLSGEYLCENSIYAGNPAKQIKSNIRWEW